MDVRSLRWRRAASSGSAGLRRLCLAGSQGNYHELDGWTLGVLTAKKLFLGGCLGRTVHNELVSGGEYPRGQNWGQGSKP